MKAIIVAMVAVMAFVFIGLISLGADITVSSVKIMLVILFALLFFTPLAWITVPVLVLLLLCGFAWLVSEGDAK